MQLKFAVLFIVIALVGADDDDCGKRKAGACVERMLSVILDDITEEEACNEMRLVADCLRNAADECLGEERDAEVDRSLEELDNLLLQSCPAKQEESDEIDKCFDENQQYLLQCIPESMTGVNDLLGSPDEINMDVMKCAMYKVMSNCLLDRAAEKCGEAARQKTKQELDNMPLTIRESCSAQASVSFFSAQLLDRKRK